MLPSISPPAENDFRNKAGKWNLYSMSTLNNLLQNTLYSRIELIQTGKKSRSHTCLKKPLVRYANLELDENRKDEQMIDLEKEENSTDTHILIFSISTFCTDITTEREHGGITGHHNYFHSCFRP